MKKIFLRVPNGTNKEEDNDVFIKFTPEINSICSNAIRAGIIHLLISSPETLHSMKVENLSFRLGIRQSHCIHHLEKLKDWRLVEVKTNQKYGGKTRRTIWGLDIKHPNWIKECYDKTLNYFFEPRELNNITNKNKSFR